MIILEYNPAFNILWILLGAIGIGLVVFLLRKFVPGLKGDDTHEDDQKIAEENVKRKIVEFKEEDEEEE